MGTKNNPGACDCYAKADPDEPLFTLLARDKHAPTLVWLWATLRELDGETEDVVREARECSLAMMGYAHAHGRNTVGLGQAGFAAMVELIRTANAAVKDGAKNTMTTTEDVRRFLAFTYLGAPPEVAS